MYLKLKENADIILSEIEREHTYFQTMDAIRKMTAVIKNGPEQMNIFDEDLFDSLVEKVIAESQTRIRFRLYGGLELAEQLEVAAR